MVEKHTGTISTKLYHEILATPALGSAFAVDRLGDAAPLLSSRRHYAFMKKLVPFILAYFIVATCKEVYSHGYRHFVSRAPGLVSHNFVAVVLEPGMSQAELDAKLQQVGLSEAVPHVVTSVRPAPIFSLVVNYVFDAFVFAAFAGLVILFQRKFRSEIPDHVDAA
jgi:hypothetical protein